MSDYDAIMKRCSAGTTNYGAANGLHADCYGAIGRLRHALRKVRKWVNEEGWCPICDEHHCRKGYCILAELGGDDE
jgi:hypothetical protein